MARKADTAEALLRGILSYVRTAGRIAGPGSLSAVIGEAAERHACRLSEKRIRLSLACGDRLPATALPGELLMYVLDTLFSIAAALAPAGGSVVVTAETVEPGLSEVGMPAAAPEGPVKLSVLFDTSGTCTGDSLTLRDSSLGHETSPHEIGLRLMAELLELHGGSCSVRCDAETGKGLFTLTLPV